MADDARISTALPRHPKTVKLQRQLEAPGCWSLVCLFLWVAENRPDGDLRGMSAEDIEIAANWSQKPGDFVRILAEVRFLDGEEAGYRIHDWAEHNPYVASRPQRVEAARLAAAGRWRGKTPEQRTAAGRQAEISRRQDHAHGSVRFDRRRRTWNFLWYEAGKRRSKLIGTKQNYPTKAAAWKAVERLQVGQQKVQNGQTVRSVIARYETERMPSRHSTARVYRSFLNNHILPEWGDTPIQAVQPRPVELWLRELPLAPKSKTHVRSLLHSLVDFAMWAGILEIARNPISLVVNNGATKRVRKARSLTAEQFGALLSELHEPFATMALLCVCLGLRISEALALRWSDVDWLGSRLSIRRGIVEQHVDDCKTEGSAKALVHADGLLSRLKAWKQASQFRDAADWVFASPFSLGRLPYSYGGTRDELTRAAKISGLGHISTHAFRHTYRSWLDATGPPVSVQQKMMRHASIKTTMDIYGDVVTDEMSTASRKVAELAFPSNGAQAERKAS